MREVEVRNRKTADSVCRVIIGRGLLGTVLPDLRAALPGRPFYLVTDANVARAGYVEQLVGEEQIGAYVIDPPGESSKNLATVTAIVTDMERRSLGRDTVVIALGGGTVGDVGGFAAAIFKRGVSVVQAPTTTVAQADSAIGGKTGVDSDLSKNAFGAFHYPLRIYVDVATLTTVGDRDYRAGLVESVKHGLIADAAYFELFESRLDAILSRSPDILELLAEKNATIKGAVVEQDPDERGLRRALNYGHTIGHAIETASGYGLLHGEAVALGMLGAAWLGEELKLAGPAVRERTQRVLTRLGMPERIPAGVSDEQILEAMSRDKKALNKTPRFVLVGDVGHLHQEGGNVAVEVEPGLVRQALRRLR